MSGFTKAKVELYLDSDLWNCQIVVNDKPLPYKEVGLHMDFDKKIIRLVRNIGDDGLTNEYLIEHPIVEHFEADPFIVARNFDDLPRYRYPSYPYDHSSLTRL